MKALEINENYILNLNFFIRNRLLSLCLTFVNVFATVHMYLNFFYKNYFFQLFMLACHFRKLNVSTRIL